MSLEATLKKWCDKYLALGVCYGGDKDRPISKTDDKYQIIFSNPISDEAAARNRQGVLTYQDGTACSASYAFSDVYKIDNGYRVYTRVDSCAVGECFIYIAECANLAEVLDTLVNYSFHDPNSTGDMLLTLIHNYALDLPEDSTIELFNRRIPILAKCGDDPALIAAIEKYPAAMDS